MVTKQYLQLTRAPNMFTAVTNVFTGYAAIGLPGPSAATVVLLAFSSVCLYTGGVVWNDYCDRDRDKIENPQRPLPSGKVSTAFALALVIGFVAMGVGLAAYVHPLGALLSLAIVGLMALYNTGLKSVPILGPINMGACRFLNVFLGACAVPAACLDALPYAGIIMAWVILIGFYSSREVDDPRMQTVVKVMILMIPLIDGAFVASLTTPGLGLAVAAFAIPAWLLSRWVYVT
ncbi:MAG: UbiA family prenyltransferase [Verrucomicrobiae bacterium]|nr:UbiA family prenyltransferase [Verrucomicrobiae bacterium]